MTEEKTTQTNPADEKVVKQIADALDETAAIPLGQIGRILEVMGEEKALALLAETGKIEAEGGMAVSSGSRQRSKGGIFFYLARQALDSKDRRYVWPSKRKSGSKKSDSGPALDWAERLEIIERIRKSAGEARTAKMTLIGRPARVVVKGDVVLVSMPPNEKQPPLPRDLPVPSAGTAMPTIVFIAAKQWQKVAESLKDPKDRLIVEGFPALDGRLKAMTVYAINTTTTALQRAKRAD
jgi:hypothetical protein